MASSPSPSRRSPSPSLPPVPSSAKLPPRPSSSTTSHVPYARQSLGPGGPPLTASSAAFGTAPGGPAASRNFSGPPGAGRSGGGGGRPSSEILGGAHLASVGGTGGSVDSRSAEAEAIDRWFQDLASYEVTLEEMAAASLDQNFTEELSAIEQWFRVLSEAERTAALYSLLQHSTQLQIRFFMTVLQQMARSDPMSALLSPASGGGMQAQMEAKLNNLRSPNRTSFGNGAPQASSRDSFGGGLDLSNYLTPESALASGDGPALGNSIPGNSNASQRKTSVSGTKPNRISAPGGLNSLSPSWMAGGSQLDQVLERGPSPSGESVASGRSNDRPKSTDFSGVASMVPGSATASAHKSSSRMSMPGSGAGLGEEVTFPLSPNVPIGNWSSMVNTPAVPMFTPGNQSTSVAHDHSGLGGSVPKLADAPKRRVSVASGYGGNSVFNEDGGEKQVGLGVGVGLKGTRNFSSPGSVGGGFQGAAGSWAQRSPALGGDGFGGSQTLGLGAGLGGGGNAFGGIGSSPSPSELAFQMSQLQLQQLQIQQLQQLQQLGAATGGVGLGGIGMGLPIGGLQGGGLALGLGALGGLNNPGLMDMLNQQQRQAQAQQTPRSASMRSQHSNVGGSATRRSPMLGVNSGVMKSPSPGGRRESGGFGGGQGGEEEVDIKVLEDIPQWLRTLRLHKYTPNFENSTWKDMVVMSDADLEAQGVAALGARRKLLKTFEAVRAQMDIPEPEGSKATLRGTSDPDSDDEA